MKSYSKAFEVVRSYLDIIKEWIEEDMREQGLIPGQVSPEIRLIHV